MKHYTTYAHSDKRLEKKDLGSPEFVSEHLDQVQKREKGRQGILQICRWDCTEAEDKG